MKQKTKKWCSVVLVILMIFSTGLLDVSASEGGQEKAKAMLLDSATDSSITLTAEDGYEYAIQKEKDKEKSWEWAEEKQYDKEKKTVIFSGLKADTEYTFAKKAKNAEAVKDEDICSYKTKAVQKEQDPAKQISSGARETVDDTGESPESEKTEESKESAENKPFVAPVENEPQAEDEGTKTDAGKDAKQEVTEPETPGAEKTEPENTKPENAELKDSKDGMVQNPEKVITENPEKKTPEPENQEEDTDKKDREEKSPYKKDSDTENTDKKDMEENNTGKKDADEKDAEQGNQEPKDEEPEVKDTVLPKPEGVPVLVSRTAAVVEFKLPEKLSEDFRDGYAFILTDSRGESVKNDAGIFTGLRADSEYTCALYIKAGTYKKVEYKTDSQAGEGLQVKTMKEAPAAPEKPAVDSYTDTKVVLVQNKNLEYAISRKGNTEVTSHEWQDGGVFENLKPDTDYEFISRVKGTDDSMPGKNSKSTNVHTKKQAAAAPKAPVLAKRTDTSVTLKNAEGQEFAVISGERRSEWQSSPVFTGLEPNMEYQFVARETFDPDKAMESKCSDPLTVKTVISFNGCTVKGISDNAVYTEGASLKVTAVGKGLDNEKPSEGDTRWVPNGWHWDGKNYKKWEKEPYTISFTVKTPGKYRLTVVYGLEEYTGAQWSAAEEQKEICVEFQVVAKKEHTTAAPKTGDRTIIWPFAAAFLLSAICIAGVVCRRRKIKGR